MPAKATAFEEVAQARFVAFEEPQSEYVSVGQAGRLVIPAAFRTAMGIKEGDKVRLSFADGYLTMESQRHAIKRVQEECRRLAKPGVSVVDELIEDRRREATLEDGSPKAGKSRA